MSGDNGKAEKEVKQEELPAIEMTIIMVPGKPVQVGFPMLNDKLATYGFLKLAEKTLDAHYAQQGKSKIIHPKGGIMDFVRGGIKK